jgi:hypothetical protein
MRKNKRTTVASAIVGLVFMAGLGIGASPVASAKSMSVNATGGDGTAVDQDGTQGSFTDSVQGKADDDGDQDAFLTQSEEATPQYKATQK